MASTVEFARRPKDELTLRKTGQVISPCRSGNEAQTHTKHDMAERKSSHESILDAAEQVFAEYGYQGAAMRLIAEEAGTAQALLHYHFKNKERLYEAMFARRSSVINNRRAELLDGLFAHGRTPSLEELLDVLFAPADQLVPGADPSAAFRQIVSAVSVADDKRSKAMMKKYYDPIGQRFIQAFLRVIPDLQPHDAVWIYLFALGARLQAYARNERATRLAENLGFAPIVAPDTQALLHFAAAGIRNLVSPQRAKAPPRTKTKTKEAGNPSPARRRKAAKLARM
jgi:AcrR family transcriptional regulator